jgi:hypothetical protein
MPAPVIPPMESTALAVCEAVVSAIVAWWEPKPPDSVERAYLIDIEQPVKLKGRKVLVAPDPKLFSQGETATREKDGNDFPVYVLVAEAYRENSGTPPVAWVDDRVKFFESLLKHLGDPRQDETGAGLFAGPLEGVYPSAQESVVGLDLDELRENRLYWGLMAVTYRVHE